MNTTSEHIEEVFRSSYGQAVATLTRGFGDIDQAEEAVQQAFLVATETWPENGVPANPTGWIITTARNRAIDSHRRSVRGHELGERFPSDIALTDQEVEVESFVKDDQLKLIFTCCHPSLRLEHQVALTLRLVGGLSVEDVARSMLVSEQAMAKRLVRAKSKIKNANIPYRVPRETELPERLQAVLTVVYLIYNSGMDRQPDLSREALRLGRLLVELMPDEPEAAGLLALMLLSESRAAARRVDGSVVLLRDQDRDSWNRDLIDEGQSLVIASMKRRRPGPYQLQAAIQAVHSDARTFDDTQWPRILSLYDQLYDVTPTPVVALNRAIVVGEIEGPESGLAEITALGDTLNEYYLSHAARASMLVDAGRKAEAEVAFQRAIELAPSEAEQRSLARRLADLSQ